MKLSSYTVLRHSDVMKENGIFGHVKETINGWPEEGGEQPSVAGLEEGGGSPMMTGLFSSGLLLV